MMMGITMQIKKDCFRGTAERIYTTHIEKMLKLQSPLDARHINMESQQYRLPYR